MTVKLKVLAIVPVYNEEKNIVRVINEIREKADYLDILVINDASLDDTAKIVSQTGVNIISHSSNLGIGGAVQTGFKFAVDNDYDIALQIDGDGQHFPGEVRKLIEPIMEDEYDVVIGSRYKQRGGFSASLLRRAGIWIFSSITSLIVKQKITDVTSGFRAYNKKALKFCSIEYPIDFPDAEAIILLKFAGFRIKEIPITMKKRLTGTSSTGILKSVYYPFKNIISILAGVLRGFSDGKNI